MSLQFSPEAKQKLDALRQRYPSSQPVVLAALHLALKEHGDLREEVMRLVADTLDLPYPHVYGVKTFYTMFNVEGGKTTLRVCTNISCMLRGAYGVLRAFSEKLGLEPGESNDQFSLVEEECIAACANAPAVVVGTEYLLDVTPDQVEGIIAELRKHPRTEGEVA